MKKSLAVPAPPSAAAVRKRPSPTAVNGEAETTGIAVYRPFFLAGILTVLTAGCLLGAIALVGIARQGGIGGAPEWMPYILAHANAQLYGWVGFFVMGFALQQHPPRVARRTLYFRLAWAQFALLAVAIVLRFVAEPLAASTDPARHTAAVTIGVTSAWMQALAVALFLANIGMTRYRQRDRENPAGLPWQSKFVFASLTWWLIAASIEPWIFSGSHAADPLDSIPFVATWFIPYREIQFLGFVPLMIFGVALARFSSDLGFRPAHQAPAEVGFGLWQAAIVLRAFGWLRYASQGDPAGLSLYHAGGVLLAIAAVLLVIALRVFEPAEGGPLPAHKFLRGSICWLLFSGLLMALEPILMRLAGTSFSHAYTGGIRHALTVGFISQMIFGVAAHFVPRLRGQAPRQTTPALWGAFVLLNLGNGLRVLLEIASDYTRAAYSVIGSSGFIEIVGLALWAAYICRYLLRPDGRVGAGEPMTRSV